MRTTAVRRRPAESVLATESDDAEAVAAPQVPAVSAAGVGARRLLGPLTPLGLGVLAVAVLALFGGWWADAPELVAIGLAAAAAVLQAVAWMVISPDLLTQREIQPVRVAQGEPARALLLVQNLSGRRCPPILATDRVGSQSVSIPVSGLAAGAARTTSYPLPTDRRGVFGVGPFSIGHTDPLRLMASTRRYDVPTVLTVHPRVHPVLTLPTGLNRDAEGATSASSPQGGIAFHSLREYRIGDPMRNIAWRKSAQTGTLFVLHKVIPDEPSLMVVLDTSGAAYAGDGFEDAARIAASLCLAALSGGHPLELRTTGGDAVVGNGGRDARGAVLDLLAAATPTASDPGLAALSRIVPNRAAVSLGVVTGSQTPDQLGMLPLIRPRYLMVSAIRLQDQRTRLRDVPGVFTLACTDSEDFARRWNGALTR